jgi:transposase-like protein
MRLEIEHYSERIYKEYKAIAPGTKECLLQDKDILFRYISFPVEHQKTIQNTNLIEPVI